MKRSEMLNLIANQLDFLDGKFEGMRSGFSPEEISRADVILTTIEQAGMQPPYITLEELYPSSGLTCDIKYYYAVWEKE